MMLIADSGATKTDWRFIDNDDKIHSFSSAGLSPLFWTSKEMAEEINAKTPKQIKLKLKSQKLNVYFYGASCSSKERIQIVYTAIKKNFPKAKIEIHHDILASARALLGKQSGIACILGTGSNSCYYDGKKITETKGGLAFILGDEGSGSHIGKELIKAYLNNELPLPLEKKFINTFHLTKNKIFDAVYNKKYPNTYLASFARFVHENKQEEFLHQLVHSCLTQFFEKTVSKYNNHQNQPVGFVGSIAASFEDILRKVAHEKSISIGKIIKSPIEELVKYHTS